MKERFTTLLAWLAFLCLLFGALPLGAMAIGYQLEAMQDKPTLKTLSCEEIASSDSEYQLLYRTFEAAEKDGVSVTSGSIEKFNPQICRVAGSGTAIQWQRGADHGFIYTNLSEEQAYERLGYRTLFHALSRERWIFTALKPSRKTRYEQCLGRQHLSLPCKIHDGRGSERGRYRRVWHRW